MPIGIPKVSYRLPGDPLPQWVDIYNRLYRERILFLGSEIDDELSNQLVGIMLFLNSEDASLGMFLYVNSPGGSVTSGMAIYDVMNHISAHVTTICMGLAASMASFIVAGGEPGSRLALQHSRMMIHQPLAGSNGQASDIRAEAEEVMRIRQQIGLLYARRTGQSLSRIARDMDRDTFMTALEAQAYGLVDRIAQPLGKQS